MHTETHQQLNTRIINDKNSDPQTVDRVTGKDVLESKFEMSTLRDLFHFANVKYVNFILNVV